MLSLFSTDPSKTGFRLKYMELCNWGTFDKNIIRINPECNNSLLTGSNASGKTTLVDGMLTLLVPEVKSRFYNQSSGASNKKERTEETYVHGNYSRIQEENKLKSTVQSLRPDKHKILSILLANFSNEGTSQDITLLQLRWFQNNELKKEYIISYHPLTIKDDLNVLFSESNISAWKQEIKRKYNRVKENIFFYNSPGKYSSHFIKLFGMRSEKALSLFSQTIGIKVLGRIDEFIRRNMLEEYDTNDDFRKLKEGYNELLDAHTAIEKADVQLNMLKFIVDLSKELDYLITSEQFLDNIEGTIEPYFISKKIDLSEKEIQSIDRDLKALEYEINTLNLELETKREEQKDLYARIANNEIGNKIKELELDIKNKVKYKEKIEKELNRYNKEAKKLGFTQTPTKEIFYETFNLINQKEEEFKFKYDDLTSRNNELTKEKSKLEDTINYKEKELKTLLIQNNKITGLSHEIRKSILLALQVGEKEIPFVGELIKVKDSEMEWEKGIERALHSFGLSLIVPEKYYSKVNEYVSKNNIYGRIVYFRVSDNVAPRIFNDYSENNTLLSKIEIRADSKYYEWVREQILNNYNYICTNASELKIYDKALTKTGVIKSGNKNEKDDRPKSLEKSNYILGWDNYDKVVLITSEVSNLRNKEEKIDKDIKLIFNQISKVNDEIASLNNLKDIQNFSDIDVQYFISEIVKIEAEKKKLQDSNDAINELKTTYDLLEKQIISLDNDLKDFIGSKTKRSDSLNSLKNDLNSKKNVIKKYNLDDLTYDFKNFEEYFKNQKLEYLNLDNFNVISTNVNSTLSQNKNKIIQDKSQLTIKITSLMINFKQPNEEIIKRFPDWTSQLETFSTDIKFIETYIELYDKIIKDDLPNYKSEFKKYLTDNMITKMTQFSKDLEYRNTDILDSIDSLNSSLKKINFKNNPPTYIQIKTSRSNAPNIKEFKNDLVNWKPNMMDFQITKDESILENSFRKIQELIKKLESRETWRKEVLDVRNWNEFLPVEFYRENDKQYKVYENTNELSGGEKPQISYTILGASIAYQFGIDKEGTDSQSFRFIIVDEAFSNQDNEKSTYLMDLCNQLHLQLLVVTPNDKIHIVEPYISYIHFVQRIKDRHSILVDMSIKQYIENKDKFNEAQV